MILYQYWPFSKQKIREIEAKVEMAGHPDILVIDHGTHTSSATLQTFLEGGEYSLTPREAIEARIEIQKRILEREAEILAKAEEDLAEYL